ncbi:unnamed protein product [Periconia digitata]|uniref:Uncharacterized protein n=1 Tax=Periconia digitata TaxID=1303443 RepID=A0A9W4XUD0_9PLEO|nr:unnamed protein product [Periconia digitata]
MNDAATALLHHVCFHVTTPYQVPSFHRPNPTRVQSLNPHRTLRVTWLLDTASQSKSNPSPLCNIRRYGRGPTGGCSSKLASFRTVRLTNKILHQPRSPVDCRVCRVSALFVLPAVLALSQYCHLGVSTANLYMHSMYCLRLPS